MCHFYEKGKCTKGATSCRYSHDLAACVAANPRYRSRYCNLLDQCRRKNCAFAHTETELDTANAIRSSVKHFDDAGSNADTTCVSSDDEATDCSSQNGCTGVDAIPPTQSQSPEAVNDGNVLSGTDNATNTLAQAECSTVATMSSEVEPPQQPMDDAASCAANVADDDDAVLNAVPSSMIQPPLNAASTGDGDGYYYYEDQASYYVPPPPPQPQLWWPQSYFDYGRGQWVTVFHCCPSWPMPMYYGYWDQPWAFQG